MGRHIVSAARSRPPNQATAGRPYLGICLRRGDRPVAWWGGPDPWADTSYLRRDPGPPTRRPPVAPTWAFGTLPQPGWRARPYCIPPRQDGIMGGGRAT